jgi:hypothetical protein
MSYAVVLSDVLLKEFYAFKSNLSHDKITIENLLQNYKNTYLTNVAQLKRIGIDNKPLFSSLLSSGFMNQTIEELSTRTKDKLILHETNDNYPYLNIFSDTIESNYTATHYKQNNRTKAKEHIKALLQNANHIFIYDKYIKDRWSESKKLFTELFPNKSLNIFYTENHLDTKQSELKNLCRDWNIKKDSTNTTYKNLHDRYIIIDNSIEIILTSGIDNLFDESSDITYIVRDKK